MDLVTVFNWILRSYAMASVIAVVVLVTRFILKDKVGAKWHYALWLGGKGQSHKKENYYDKAV